MSEVLAIGLIVGVFLLTVVVGAVASIYSEDSDRGVVEGVRPWRSDRAPFMLIVDEEFLDSRVEDACVAALSFWEDHVPGLWVSGVLNMVSMVPVIPSDRYERIANDSVSDFVVAHTSIRVSEGLVTSAAIYVDADKADALSDLELWRAIAHEMGHAVGLDHDETRLSVMYRKTLNEIPTVTAADKALLKAIYFERGVK